MKGDTLEELEFGGIYENRLNKGTFGSYFKDATPLTTVNVAIEEERQCKLADISPASLHAG